MLMPVVKAEALQVLMCRHTSKDKVTAVIQLVPDPRKLRGETNGSTADSSEALYLLTVAQEYFQAHAADGAAQGVATQERTAVWAIDSVKVVPVQFVNAWPQRRT